VMVDFDDVFRSEAGGFEDEHEARVSCGCRRVLSFGVTCAAPCRSFVCLSHATSGWSTLSFSSLSTLRQMVRVILGSAYGSLVFFVRPTSGWSHPWRSDGRC
jgi:hypothetical protein